ncbi:stage II sporulation protein P [Shouchella patagoniensis]|uniref:stage II sporulation protein P n=1 Tax=Shouchella patagoniensis TaxID=228576 RepID=UPI0009956CD5|nr:stage II sporulation protein P [Shouchella patagoniensis]
MHKWLLISLITSSFFINEQTQEVEIPIESIGQAVEYTQLNIEYKLAEDDVSRSYSTLATQGKEVARVFIHVDSAAENAAEQLRFAYKLHETLEKTFPGLSRGIVSSDSSQLINRTPSLFMHIGGVENTKEEVDKTFALIKEIVREIQNE